MYILQIDSSMGIPVQKLQQCPHSTLKGYQDTIDYRDIFRVTIVSVAPIIGQTIEIRPI